MARPDKPAPVLTNQCRHLELLRREDGKYWDCGGCGERFTLRPFPDEPPAPPVQVPDVSADLSQYGFAFVLVRPGGATYRIDPLDVTLQKFPDQPENRS